MSDRIPFRSPIKRLKTLPVLPTILTAGNLACGVTAIMCAAHGRLELGAILIFAGMVCDMFDGKLARLTNTEGAFGAELDSLADVVSFGVAPAMLVHALVLDGPGVFAPGERGIWLVAIFFCVMAAIRLARYNVEHEDGKATEHFRGLPSPGAAALLCSWVIYYEEMGLAGSGVPENLCKFGLMAATLICGSLMVSNIPFPHVGNTMLGDRGPFRRVILIILAMFLIAQWPVYGLVTLTTGYTLYGAIPGLWQSCKRWLNGRALIDDDEDDERPNEKLSNAG